MKLKQLKCKKGCFSYTYTRKLYKYMSLHIRIYYFFVIKKNHTHNKPQKHKNVHTHTTSYIYFKINLIIFCFFALRTFKRRCNFLTLLRIKSKFCIEKNGSSLLLIQSLFHNKISPASGSYFTPLPAVTN